MYVYVSDSSVLPDLEDFLTRTGCFAERSDAHALEVFVRLAYDDLHARRELDVCLDTWQRMNPEVEASVLDGPRDGV
jgi:hypothetical protein